MYLILKVIEPNLTPADEQELLRRIESGRVQVHFGGYAIDAEVVQKSIGFPS